MPETAQSNADSGVIETLLAMKETRGHKYYQVWYISFYSSIHHYSHFAKVLWLGKEDIKVTWEPASSLPETVVSAFNSGEECKAVEQMTQQYGQEACTLSVESNPVDAQFPKKSRRDRPVLESNDGCVCICEGKHV